MELASSLTSLTLNAEKRKEEKLNSIMEKLKADGMVNPGAALAGLAEDWILLGLLLEVQWPAFLETLIRIEVDFCYFYFDVVNGTHRRNLYDIRYNFSYFPVPRDESAALELPGRISWLDLSEKEIKIPKYTIRVRLWGKCSRSTRL